MINYIKVKRIIKKLERDKIDRDIASPNYIAEYSYNRGYKLTSDEVVYISNKY